jgi:external thioesterase TEII
MRKPQLFLLHFAGGNYYSYHFLLPMLDNFEVIPLELPGRCKRVKEALLNDFDAAAMDIYRQVAAKIKGQPFIIYGHSLGAYLALRVSNMLQRAGRPPAYLVVSGNAGPGSKDHDDLHLLDSDAFFEGLKKLGGLPDEILENEELLSYFEPILRADFKIAEQNFMTGEPAVNVPIYAMMGSQEEKAGEISNWANYTKKDFGYTILEGDHFFIYKHPAQIAGIIKECCSAINTVQHQY